MLTVGYTPGWVFPGVVLPVPKVIPGCENLLKREEKPATDSTSAQGRIFLTSPVSLLVIVLSSVTRFTVGHTPGPWPPSPS